MNFFFKSKVAAGTAVTLCLVLLTNDAWGWGAGGHMIVARIAYLRLNARAKAEVDKLIAMDIEPKATTATSLDFVNASHWADDLRPSKSFADTLPLHFVDFPFSVDGTELPSELPEQQNVITALQKYVDVLRSNADDAQRAQALRFIIHFVGDIHQPLHCATQVSSGLPDGDRGGNLFIVTVIDHGRRQKVKLHSYWDGGIGNFPKSGPNFEPPLLTQVAAAAQGIEREFPDTDPALKKGGPMAFDDWARESFQLAQTVAYKGLRSNGEASQIYIRTATKTARQRVAWGGYRLAALLNAIWPDK